MKRAILSKNGKVEMKVLSAAEEDAVRKRWEKADKEREKKDKKPKPLSTQQKLDKILAALEKAGIEV